MRSRGRAPAVIGLGMLGSQAGHLLAYQFRFGAAAQQVQSTGAHAYFPFLAKTTLGAVACVLIGVFVLVGLARILSGRLVRSRSEPSYVSLLAVLFSIQLAVFAGQEVSEALVAGSTVGSAADLLLWGSLGQLPIAAVAALALCWLSTRIEAAFGVIKRLVSSTAPAADAVYVRIPVCATPDRALLMSSVAGSSLAKRGPPFFLPISS